MKKLKNYPYFRNRSVNTGLLNEKKQAPVHLATELNKVNALKVMGNYRQIIDIQKGGEHGRTALHLAAIYDHEECARILVGFFFIFRLRSDFFLSLSICLLSFFSHPFSSFLSSFFYFENLFFFGF